MCVCLESNNSLIAQSLYYYNSQAILLAHVWNFQSRLAREKSKRHVRRFLVCVISGVRFNVQSTGFIAAYLMVVLRSTLEQFKCCWKIVVNTVSVPGSTCLVVCLFHQRRFWHIFSEAIGAVCCPFLISLRAVAHELIPKGVFRFEGPDFVVTITDTFKVWSSHCSTVEDSCRRRCEAVVPDVLGECSAFILNGQAVQAVFSWTAWPLNMKELPSLTRWGSLDIW